MSTEAETVTATSVPRWRRWWSGSRRYWIAGAVTIAASLALGWKWLAAIGALPLLLVLLPCAAMCALGACMKHTDGQSCGQSPTGGNERNGA